MKITEIKECPSDLRYFDKGDLKSKLQLKDVEDIIEISKIQFKEIRHQIDHELYSKQTPSIKNSLSTYVSTRSDDEDKSMKGRGKND